MNYFSTSTHLFGVVKSFVAKAIVIDTIAHELILLYLVGLL